MINMIQLNKSLIALAFSTEIVLVKILNNEIKFFTSMRLFVLREIKNIVPTSKKGELAICPY